MLPFYQDSLVTIYHGDCVDVMKTIGSSSIDAVITDPPYPRKYLPLYESVAVSSKRVLVDGGSLLMIVPHYALPEVLEIVKPHLKYRWIHSMWQEDGQHPRMAMGIEIMWKPIVWWVKRAWPQGRGFVRDGFRNTPPSKEFYEWEQSFDWANFCLRMVPSGGTVLDPLMGVGTSLIEAKGCGYKAIGIDNSEERCAVAAERLASIS